RENMGVLEGGLDVDLAQKALGTERGGELGPEHLDRDVAVVLPVVGMVHMGHAPGPDLTIEIVTVRKCGPQAINLVHDGGAHARPWWGARRGVCAPPVNSS